VLADDEFDPFGAPSIPLEAFNLPPGAAPAQPGGGPKTAQFEDEDDFDFSDLPAAQVEQSPAANHGIGPSASDAFEDEFAGFDDEFEQPSSQVNSGSSNSYEMVSPNHPPQSLEQEINAPAEAPPSQPVLTSHNYDEWGFGSGDAGNAASAHPSSAPPFSFDDAFGGEFEPAHPADEIEPAPQEPQYAPPPGLPPAKEGDGLNPPPMPERRDSTAQPDDLEDVKKLCAMGFSRTLAIGALEANGYDFQKALNVLVG